MYAINLISNDIFMMCDCSSIFSKFNEMCVNLRAASGGKPVQCVVLLRQAQVTDEDF